MLGFMAYAWFFLLPMALLRIPLFALVVEGCIALLEQDPDE
ncbi:hypothetical protein [Marinobacterium weihaiense]|nr:hypothetical protein [Marinobacterium weihaiense]